jgi:hypothetical protein
MGDSFYPHGGPKEYSYVSAFYDFRAKTGAEAKANTAYNGIGEKGGGIPQVLVNLQMLVDGARNAEMAFLADTGIDLTNNNNAKAIFENFNLILNSQQLFARNLAMFKQLSQGVNNKLIDPTKYFYTYLAQGIEKYGKATNLNVRKLTGPQLEKMADQILGYALEETYRRFVEVIDKQGNIKSLSGGEVIGNQEQYQAVQEMASIIKKLRDTGLFGKYASLFNIEGLLEQSSNKQGEVIKKPKLTTRSFDQGGTALELITSVVATEIAKTHYSTNNGFMGLTITGAQTGSGGFNQQKGDSMIAYAEGETDFSEMERIFKKHNTGQGSKRLQNIDALEEYLNKVGEKIKHLLVISDKNYKITTNWKGVHAQESMSLKDAEAMLGKFGVPQINTLINYLANCGPGMLQGEANGEIRTGLATYIGYFLFDHLEITGTVTGGTNVVNIINLSGTYIPLSVYLEGVYKSLESKMVGNVNYNNLVNVTISPGGGDAPHATWTAGLWQGYRDAREAGTSIEYRIMKDIASFITGLMG